MTLTALMMLEITLWMEEGVHIITLSERILGPIGKTISWVVYLFIGYASLTAYISEGGALLSHASSRIDGIGFSKWAGCILFGVVFGFAQTVYDSLSSFAKVSGVRRNHSHHASQQPYLLQAFFVQ